jgi:hypothetical protein
MVSKNPALPRVRVRVNVNALVTRSVLKGRRGYLQYYYYGEQDKSPPDKSPPRTKAP